MNEEICELYEMSLTEIREHRGYSRRELSQLLHGEVSEDTLYSIEKRGQMPRLDTAVAISKALGISLDIFSNSIGLDVYGLPASSGQKAKMRSRNQGGEGENQH